jgi:DNA-binding transcriptional ArsR family regulator
MSKKQMTAEERAQVFKALSDPRRIEIVDRLARGSLCGTELADSMGISLALLCHHWEVLVDAGILRKERRGQLRVCSLDGDRLRDAMNLTFPEGLNLIGLPGETGRRARAATKPRSAKKARKPRRTR